MASRWLPCLGAHMSYHLMPNYNIVHTDWTCFHNFSTHRTMSWNTILDVLFQPSESFCRGLKKKRLNHKLQRLALPSHNDRPLLRFFFLDVPKQCRAVWSSRSDDTLVEWYVIFRWWQVEARGQSQPGLLDLGPLPLGQAIVLIITAAVSCWTGGGPLSRCDRRLLQSQPAALLDCRESPAGTGDCPITARRCWTLREVPCPCRRFACSVFTFKVTYL